MFFRIVLDLVNSKGQMSVDLLIAVSVLVLSITMASYYVISAFVPYSGRDIDLQAAAYRVAMILSEDGGIWSISTSHGWLIGSNWVDHLNDVRRIGLANTSPTFLIKRSYEVQIPCYLNETKVITFFNLSVWESLWNTTKTDTLDRIANLIGLNTSVKTYEYNISLRFMNGSYVKCNGRPLTIGYPLYVNGKFIPQEFGKFERIVVLDNNKSISVYRYDPDNPDPSKCFLRLVVYVW